MGASVVLSESVVAVEPGATAWIDVRIRNDGTVVDQYTIDVVGDAAAWTTVAPATVSLFPGADGSVRITFAPPRVAATPSGAVAFGIRVRSSEDPAGSAVEEGTANVGTFLEPFAELVPRTARGSRSAGYDLALDNRGNTRLQAAIEGSDADRLVAFDVRPPELVVGAGEAGFAKVRVSPTQRFWRGTPQTRPFRLSIAPDGAPPILLDGTLLQEPMLPPWTMRAIMAAIGLLVAAILLWFLVLQPTIKSAATEALAEAGFTPIPAGASPGGGGGASPGGGGASASPGGGGATPTPTPTGAAGLADVPIDGRLDATNPSVTPTAMLLLTDLVFSNPTGAAGEVRLTRDGGQPIVLRLENFRDFDLHFVTPIVVQPNQTMSLVVTSCDSGTCVPSVFYSGVQRP